MPRRREGRCFDKLSTNGEGAFYFSLVAFGFHVTTRYTYSSTIDPIATTASGPMKRSTSANCLPNQLPAPAIALIQIVDPAAVQIRNLTCYMPTIPAGSDTIVRAMGTKRKTKTIPDPNRRNQSCNFSTSSQSSVSQRP